MQLIHGFIKLLICLILFTGLTACEMPQGGPNQTELTKELHSKDTRVSVYHVSHDLIKKVDTWSYGVNKPFDWPETMGNLPTTIEPNDTIDIVVWDNNSSSLVTTLGQKSINLENISVSKNGNVFLPYVGNVHVSGMDESTARTKIQNAFQTIIPAVQVQLHQNFGDHNSVDLVEGMGKPGSYPIGLEAMTVLDALSLGGGPNTNLRNPQIRLHRGNSTYEISLNHLYNNPSQNIRLKGNDKIMIVEDQRSYAALGASSSEKITYFEKDQITALEAVSSVGGLEETRADAKGVLILRSYPEFVTNRPEYIPEFPNVVFVINLTTAEGIFSAKDFQILSGDVVLVTEATIVKWAPVLQNLQRLLSIVRNSKQTF